MNIPQEIAAVVPVKDTRRAKQRLAGILPGARRRELALAMVADVLTALARVRELAGIFVVTDDPAAATIAASHGAHIARDGAGDGHTGAVAAAARRLTIEGLGMLALPGDIPLVQEEDIRQLIAVHRVGAARGARTFTIVPARDDRGSNAVLCSPAAAVPLRFGDDSFLPHLAAAQACGIEPRVVRLPRIALDIDTPDDVTSFLQHSSRTRAHALLARWRNELHHDTSRNVTA